MVSKTQDIIIQNPTHLFVGAPGAVAHAVIAVLQQILCTEKGCSYCVACRGIYARSSSHLMWIEPEHNYTRDLIQPIFDTLSLQRADKDHFFIVLAHAERLQHATANALLKSLEEPPFGYHFILMTVHERLVLPTIRSRALVHMITTDTHAVPDNQLYAHFIGSASLNPVQFLQALDQLDLSDQESAELLDRIIHAMQRMIIDKRISPTLSVDAVHKRVATYMHAMTMLPQSGSSKIFWKNLYLKIKT